MEGNGFSQRIAIARQDARDLSSLFPAGSLHGMACNPPYTAPGAGIASADSARRGARQGDTFTPVSYTHLDVYKRQVLFQEGDPQSQRMAACLADHLAQALSLIHI